MSTQAFLNQCILDEQQYTFPCFTKNDIWELGCCLVEACKVMDGPLAVTICLGSLEVFRYYPEGTSSYHEMWLNRKKRTVYVMERSTMRLKAELELSGSSLSQEGLDESEFVACGGGFPLRLSGGCVIGFIGVSGMDDDADQSALLDGLHRFFEKKGFIPTKT